MRNQALFLLVAIGSVVAQAATTTSATTPEFRLSVKHDGVRASAGDESLRYSSLWDGGTLSADRIKADYDMIANRKFCTYGAVKKGAE